jgi:transglutaminase-like putative cysteine protease
VSAPVANRPAGAKPDALEAARLPLRVVVAVAGLSGLLALGAAGLLSVPATVGVAVCLVAGSTTPVWLASPAEARLRRNASVVVLLLVALYAAHSALGGVGQEALLSLGPVLAVLLAGLQVAHALVLNTRRDLLVALTIGLFMTILAAGLAPGPSVALPLIVGWPVAVTALVLAQRLEQLETGHPVLRPGARGNLATDPRVPASAEAARTLSLTWRSTVSAVAVTVVAGLVVFLLLPQPGGLSARSRLLGGDTSTDSTSGSIRDTGFYSGGVMDLRTRGSLSDQPVLDVPGDSPELWRGTVLSTYDGQAWFGTDSWSAPTGSITELTPGPTYAVPNRLDQPPTGASRSDVVHLLGAFGGSAVAPGVVQAITTSGRVLVDSDGGLYLAPDSSGVLPTSYEVTSTPEVTDATALLASGKPGETVPATPTGGSRWLQLPETLPQRVRDLSAQLAAGASSRYAQVSAVETYLRTHEKYQLDSPVPAPGADAVDDFLFTSHTGFCEQFASAEVVLLRASGVPARLVTGLAYGTPTATGERRMLVSNAHAWVEVWYPGVGWSPSDPTAGAQLAGTGGGSLLDRAWRAVFGTGARRAIAAGLVALLALGTWLVVGWAGRRRRAGKVGSGGADRPAGPVLVAFRRMERALGDAGRPRRPGETLAELGRRLPAPAPTALATLERECYAALPPTDEEARAAVDAFDSLVRGLAEVTHQ